MRSLWRLGRTPVPDLIRDAVIGRLPFLGGGETSRSKEDSRPNYFAPLAASSAFVFFALMQSLRNFLRSLPFSPFASASVEHSIEAAERGFLAIVLAAAGGLEAAGAVEGAGVCAKAEPISKSDATAVAARREERVIMGSPQVEEVRKVGSRC